MASDWKTLSFEQCILELEGRKASIPRSAYQASGEYPIVDQGQEPIAGYTNTRELVYDTLPIILFGDHTRIFKFLDFPFVTGADGTKLFRANEKYFDPKFLYFNLRCQDIPARGYNRHFRILREQSIRFPEDKAEQRTIAGVLSKLLDAVEVQEKTVAALKALKAATMAKVFREGVRGERLKQTEIGEMPERWEVVTLGSLADISTGTTPSTGNAEYYAGDIPFVKTAEIDNNVITTARQFISQEALQKYGLKIYPPGTVFLAMYGQGKTRGRTSLLGVSAATTQNTAAIAPSPDVQGEYLWHYLMSQYDILRGMGNLGHLSHLNLGYVKAMRIPVPSPAEQLETVRHLSRLQHRMESAENRRSILCSLFENMLHLLMTGQVRVGGAGAQVPA